MSVTTASSLAYPSPPADRRGALRPVQLAPSRARTTGKAVSAGWRAGDIALAGLCALPFAAAAGPALLVLLAMGLVAAAAGLYLVGAYGFRARETLGAHLLRICMAYGLAAIVLIPAPFIAGEVAAEVTGVWLLCAFAASLIAHVFAWRHVRSLRKAGRLTRNIVIVGAGENARRLIEAAKAGGDVAVLGVFDDRGGDRAGKSVAGVPVLGSLRTLVDHRVMPFVDQVVIAVPSAAKARVGQIVEKISVLPNPITLFVDVEAGAALARLADAPLAYMSGKPDDNVRAAIKRAQDLVIGSLALVVAAPVMALVALAVKLDSPGPALFRQRRHGFNNEEIIVWKFRSMRIEAADARAARQVSAGDDRVTRVGRFIRKTSLDELPQIFNVLSGEMSLVGPRPHAIGMMTGDVESVSLVAEYAHRHRMKPGMTGWAAINGSRGPIDTPELVLRRVELDVEYIERQSFWLDLYIIAMTIPCLLGDRQAVR